MSPQPLHKGLDPANPEQLITPLTTLGHLAMLAPEQFAAPLKSLVANFIVKDLLMNDRVGWKPADSELSVEMQDTSEMCSSYINYACLREICWLFP